MASKVQIANGALSLVGQQTIVALTDNTNPARQCAMLIDDAIREVLGAGRWKPARKRAVLAQLSPVPAFGWPYAYQLPQDYLRIVSFNETDEYDMRQDLFNIEGKMLLTDESACSIVYVADLTQNGNDINVNDARLNELFKLKLACALAWPFQQAVTLKNQLMQEYDLKLKKALAGDAREARNPMINHLSESSWIKRRRFSTNA